MKSISALPKVLVVEDDEGHAMLIGASLAEAQLSNPIQRFSNGQEVLDFLSPKNETIAGAWVMILDARMPKVGGLEVLRKLKRDAQLKNIPVIMFTTSEDARDVAEFYRLGGNAYVQKPIDFDQFTAAIRLIGHFIGLIITPSLEQAQRYDIHSVSESEA